ncbi:MAG: mechanosensitive ion channel domain-containing protein [Gammaproteobacteria bacterium]
MFEQLDVQQLMTDYIIPWSTNIIFALLIWIIGRKVIKVLMKFIGKAFEKSNMDTVLVAFLTAIIQTVMTAFVAIAALDQLGVPTTSLVAIFGAAGLAIGLSLQDSLKNFAAGVMIILNRPFSAGHVVEVAGVMGVVEKVGVFSTMMTTPDNREITIPNGSIYGDVITNYSARDTRRIDLVIGISYDDDIKQAKEILQDILAKEDRILDDPAPGVAMGELADSSVNFNVRPWVNASDYWPVRSEILEQVKMRFDAVGLSIPYPQQDVNITHTNSSDS